MRLLLLLAVALPLLLDAQAVRTEMVFVEGGKYRMGGPRKHTTEYEKPRHCVKLKPFYMAKYETRWVNYAAFCNETGRKQPSDRGWGRGDYPVIHVSWLDAVEYCNWLSRKDRLKPCYTISIEGGNISVSCDFDANGYRLPTEAEWEYAAKGGHLKDKTTFAGSNDISEVAIHYYQQDTAKHTEPVGSKSPNALGIYDLTGNVWEWCWDWFGREYYLYATRKDPSGPSEGSSRVVRGGSWFSQPKHSRNYTRAAEVPTHHNSNLGFRVVRSAGD